MLEEYIISILFIIYFKLNILQYRTIDGLKENHESVTERYKVKPSWVIFDKTVSQWIHNNISKESNILDIGSASGAALVEFRRHGYKKISGVDLYNHLSEVNIEDFVSFLNANLNIDPLPYTDNSFDHIIAFAVLEHLENAFHFARECARVILPGGYLVITLPNIYRINSALNIFMGKNIQGYNSQNDHIMLMTNEIFDKAFGAKFDLVKTFYSQGFIRVPFLRRKIKVSNSRLFSFKVCYVLKKKT